MRIAALTDIHASSDPLQLALTAARREGFDAMLIMGDLLTYGVQPLETLELVHGAAARDGAILVAGNHDQLYRGTSDAAAYRAGLPDWLRESVDWTAAHIPAQAMERFDWQESWTHESLFAAHANPFPFGDWRYIRSKEEAEEAATRWRSAASCMACSAMSTAIAGMIAPPPPSSRSPRSASRATTMTAPPNGQ